MSRLLVEHKHQTFAEFVDVNCEFCKIPRGESNYSWVIDLEFGSIFLNFNQSYYGRCLYIPFSHHAHFKDIQDDLFIEYNREIYYIVNSLQDVLGADLINIAMLSNKVRHVHWHLIPRYEGDANWGNPPWPNVPKEISPKEFDQLKSKLKNKFIQ